MFIVVMLESVPLLAKFAKTECFSIECRQ